MALLDYVSTEVDGGFAPFRVKSFSIDCTLKNQLLVDGMCTSKQRECKP